MSDKSITESPRPLAALCNLGCSKNQLDGSMMLQRLHDAGYAMTADFSRARVILVNTCAFIQEAKMEAIDAILEMARHKKSGACEKLVVCGCFSQRFRDSVQKQFPEVDLWAGVEDWERLFTDHLGASGRPSFLRPLDAPRATQYIKISEGCSQGCAFCAIPQIRGKFRSRPVARIIEEAQWLCSQGVRECILVSQDTSHYGADLGASLVNLIGQILAHTSFPWIRLMYLHPSRVDEALLGLAAREPRLCPYFDIPLQHSEDAILRAMNRRPLSRDIRALIGRIRDVVPGASIRTTFIAGFPGETEQLFGNLLKFVEEMRLDKVGVFPFSPEEGTAAFTMRPRPRNATAERRCEMLMAAQQKISGEIGASRIGKIMEVIIDAAPGGPSAFFEGRTRGDAPGIDGKVHVRGTGVQPGDIVPVRITSADEYDLFGTVVQ